MATELKPCPFCGGAARAFKRTCDKDTRYDPADRAFPIVRCGACGACSEGDDWTELQTAIDRWNRRAQPAQAGQVLTEGEIVKCLVAAGCVGTVKMTYDSGPYEITRTSINADRFARAIEQAVLSKRVPQWLPIETAPKDGTRVILAWGGKSINGFYLDNSKTRTPWQGWRVESMVVQPSGVPAHWMPLPPPPGIVGEKGGA